MNSRADSQGKWKRVSPHLAVLTAPSAAVLKKMADSRARAGVERMIAAEIATQLRDQAVAALKAKGKL